ncbi:unnamed protein product [Cylicocyclus nassatus]|uniref:Uncharacterized protein n=1 Tax=Cylicocyclus nassatus TaxID=53992 RepID=A0AA36H8H4_CYLNA|nr:unnamed protein product [Cylicocyclus nassatus]
MQALLLRSLLLFMIATIVFPAFYTVTTTPVVYPKVYPYSNFYDDLEEDRPIHRERRQFGWGGPWGYGGGPWGFRRPWGWGPRPWGFGGPFGWG